MKKLKKYAGGGSIPMMSGIPHPNNDLIENEIMEAGAEAKAAANPWTNALSILGQAGMQYGAKIGGPKAALLGSAINTTDYLTMAFGGRVGLAPASAGQGSDVEVEGGEVIETPDGTTMKTKGPKHEQGGINTNLPVGAEVFSDRINVDGETISNRKEKRAKKLTKLEKKMEESPQDSTLRQTYQRMKENDEVISNQEMQLQEMIQTVLQTNQPADTTEMIDMPEMGYGGEVGKQKMAAGGVVDPRMLFLLSQAMNPDTSAFDPNNMFPDTFGGGNMEGVPGGKMSPMTSKSGGASGAMAGAQPQSGTLDMTESFTGGGQDGGGIFNNLPNTGVTGGDAVGMLGNLISTFGPMQNTKEARGKDRPNINYFENYGEDALNTIDESKGFLDDMRDNAMQDLEVSKRGAMNTNRKSARGVNTMRALDIGTQQSAMGQERKINNEFSARMLDILGQEAGLENTRDFRQMFGEQQKDIADRMDQDAYYSQLAQDLATKGQGIQKIGGDLNRIQEQDQIQNLLSQMTKYFDIDSAGNITKKGQ